MVVRLLSSHRLFSTIETRQVTNIKPQRLGRANREPTEPLSRAQHPFFPWPHFQQLFWLLAPTEATKSPSYLPRLRNLIRPSVPSNCSSQRIEGLFFFVRGQNAEPFVVGRVYKPGGSWIVDGPGQRCPRSHHCRRRPRQH